MLPSILINNYNYDQYLNQCIDSVLNQSYKDIEIIVYDDGSIDNSLKILKSYGDRIKVIANNNYGKSPNLNQANGIYQAFLESKGDVIFLLDSDDVFHDEKVKIVLDFFYKYKDVDVVQHPLIELSADGFDNGIIRPVLKKVNNYKEYIFSNNDLSNLFVSTSGLCFRRHVLNTLLPLEEDSYQYLWPDARLMLNSALLYKIKTLEKPLTYYRFHGNNHSDAWKNNEGHRTLIKQQYNYFNSISLKYGEPKISFNVDLHMENSYFYKEIDKEKIIKFIKNNKVNSLWIWGAGEAGQSLAYFVQKEQDKCFIEGFIDKNPVRENEIIMGMVVKSPDYLNYSRPYKILCSPYHAYEEVSTYLKSNNQIEGLNYIFPYKREGQ